MSQRSNLSAMDLKRLVVLGFKKACKEPVYVKVVRNSKNKMITCVIEQNGDCETGEKWWVIDILGYDFMEGVNTTGDVMRYIEMVRSGELDQEESVNTLWSITEKGLKSSLDLGK
jgi:hypothetical protein